MKHGPHSLRALVLLGGIAVAGSALGAEPPVGQMPAKKEYTTPITKQRASLVTLECKRAGDHIEIFKIVAVKNTTSKTMPTGHTINWAANDGDKGVITLNKPLPAGWLVSDKGTKPCARAGLHLYSVHLVLLRPAEFQGPRSYGRTNSASDSSTSSCVSSRIVR